LAEFLFQKNQYVFSFQDLSNSNLHKIIGLAFYTIGIRLKEHSQVPNKEDEISMVGSKIDTRGDIDRVTN
jgi:hypothetical protein